MSIDKEIVITVTLSAGDDGATLIFIDTPFEPDGSDGSRGLRIVLNDDSLYDGVRFKEPAGGDRPANHYTFRVHTDSLQYYTQLHTPAIKPVEDVPLPEVKEE